MRLLPRLTGPGLVRAGLTALLLIALGSGWGRHWEAQVGDIMRSVLAPAGDRARHPQVLVLELPARYAFVLPLSVQRRVAASLRASGARVVAWEYFFAPAEGAAASPSAGSAGAPVAPASGSPLVVHRICKLGEQIQFPIPEILQEAAALGSMEVSRDPDRVVRELPFGWSADYCPLGLRAADAVTSCLAAPALHYQRAHGRRLLLDSHLGVPTLAADVFARLQAGERLDLRGALVFVGVCEPTLTTQYELPRGRTLPAVAVQATLAANLLTGSFTTEAQRWGDVTSWVLLAGLGLLSVLLARPKVSGVALALAAVVLTAQIAALAGSVLLPMARVWLAGLGTAALFADLAQERIYSSASRRQLLVRELVQELSLARNALHAYKNLALVAGATPGGAGEEASPPQALGELKHRMETDLAPVVDRIAKLERPLLELSDEFSPPVQEALRASLPVLLDRFCAARRQAASLDRRLPPELLRQRLQGLSTLIKDEADPEGCLLGLCQRILQEFELGQVMAQATAAARGHDLRLELVPGLLWRSLLTNDAGPLRDVIADTLANAADAWRRSPTGVTDGGLVVRIYLEEQTPPYVTIWLEDDGPRGAQAGLERLGQADTSRGTSRGYGFRNAVQILRQVYGGAVVAQEEGATGSRVGLTVRTI